METKKVSDSELALKKEDLELTSQDAISLINEEKLKLSDEYRRYIEKHLKSNLAKTFDTKSESLKKEINKLKELNEKMSELQEKVENSDKLDDKEATKSQRLEKEKDERTKLISKLNGMVQKIEASKTEKMDGLSKVFDYNCVELVKITKETSESFRKKIVDNSTEDKKFFYIINGTVDKNSHWFLVIQDKTKIYIIDSLGKQRMEFINILVPEIDDFDFYKSDNQLQYSSGVCEMYAIKLAFYILRSQIFNDINGRFQGILTNIKEKTGKLDKVFEAGLDEVAFGRFETMVDRVHILETQKKLLEEQKLLMYGFEEDETVVFFNQKFAKDLTRSIEMFDGFEQISIEKIIDVLLEKYKLLVDSKEDNQKLISELGINKSDYLNIINSLKELIIDNEEVFKTALQKLLSMNPITKNSFTNITKNKKEQRFNEYLKEELSISFDQFKVIFDTFEKIKNSRGVCLELNKEGIVDFSNKNTSLRAGHMYWSMLEATEQLKEADKDHTRHLP